MNELPSELRLGIDEVAAGRDLRAAARRASHKYRAGGPTVVTSSDDAVAYAVWRMPATYSATLGALTALREATPGFEPRTIMDVGAGPGTAAWAATTVFPSIDDVIFVERQAHMRDVGRRLAQHHPVLARARWTEELDDASADLVVAAYALSEIGSDAVDGLWTTARAAVAIVEPGTPRGFETVLAARAQLIAAGAHIAAPCPSHMPCPMADGPRWCHFTARLTRSAQHRALKDASLPYEDEPFSYVTASRSEPSRAAARLVGRPRFRKRLVRLELCTADGITERTVTPRDAAYKGARKLRWGDAAEL